MAHLHRLLPARWRIGVYRTAQFARDIEASLRQTRTLQRETRTNVHHTHIRADRLETPIAPTRRPTGGEATFLSLDAVIAVRPGETVLEAGLRHDLDLTYSCTLGGCGACLLKLTSGSVTYDDPDCLCLTRDDFADGLVLACQAKPVGDVTLEDL